ncbi:MAG: sulfatase family protein [Planctomycetota bacterium]|jgi:arylsulfatase A-like enzyme
MRTCLFISLLTVVFICSPLSANERLPNFVVLFADDLGYADLGCYGHPTIHTPRLDKMAEEGMRFTQFYSAASVCTPSRAALLTGRLPIRSGLCADKLRVFIPQSAGGMPEREITVAEALKTKGYATACIGKWHLGHLPQYLPTSHGFDFYYGIPYSNDMDPTVLMRNQEVIENPAQQTTLTPRYTAEAIRFITKNRDKPFFLYLPYTFPHTPLFATKRFEGKSRRGLYGDVVEEIDWSVGKILDTLQEFALAKNTLVIFTSDNGPWLTQKQDGGSAGMLRDGKRTTFEGGMRVPAIAWWPGKIKAGLTSYHLASTMDIFATCLKLAGVELPSDRIIDGKNLASILFGTGPCQRKVLFYYRGTKLMAVRKGPWKVHLITQGGLTRDADPTIVHYPPLLYQLEYDPSEKYDVGKDHPEVIADILKEVERHRAQMKPGEPQLGKMLPEK